MRLVFLPALLARDVAMFWLDVALTGMDVSWCAVVGHDAHWQRCTTGLVRRCDRCGVSTGSYPNC